MQQVRNLEGAEGLPNDAAVGARDAGPGQAQLMVGRTTQSNRRRVEGQELRSLACLGDGEPDHGPGTVVSLPTTPIYQSLQDGTGTGPEQGQRG